MKTPATEGAAAAGAAMGAVAGGGAAMVIGPPPSQSKVLGANQASYSKSLNEPSNLYVMSGFTIAPEKQSKAKHEIEIGMT